MKDTDVVWVYTTYLAMITFPRLNCTGYQDQAQENEAIDCPSIGYS